MTLAEEFARNDGVAVALAALNVFQTLALAYMADRSRRVRRQRGPDD